MKKVFAFETRFSLNIKEIHGWWRQENREICFLFLAFNLLTLLLSKVSSCGRENRDHLAVMQD